MFPIKYNQNTIDGIIYVLETFRICKGLKLNVENPRSGIFRLTLSSTAGVSFSTSLKAVYLDFPLYLRKLVMLNIF
jgi:hypothetical protein